MNIELGLQVMILVTEYASFEERAVIKCYAMQHVQYVVNTNSKTFEDMQRNRVGKPGKQHNI